MPLGTTKGVASWDTNLLKKKNLNVVINET